jgi:hypothetical protein
MKLKRLATIDVARYMAACYTLDVPPAKALRDPVAVLPIVASASMAQAQAFIRHVTDNGPDLERLSMNDGEDAVSLFTALLFARYLGRVRMELTNSPRFTLARRNTIRLPEEVYDTLPIPAPSPAEGAWGAHTKLRRVV